MNELKRDRAVHHRMLYASYGRVHFLLNSEQCSTSLYAGEILPFRSRHPYLGESLGTDEGPVLFFDLNRFLCEVFRVQQSAGAQLALVGRLDRFSPTTAHWLERKVFPQMKRLEPLTDRVAFRLPSSTRIVEIAAEELLPHPQALSTHLSGLGVLAVHLDAESCGFLLDLDRLVRPQLLFAKTAFQESCA